MGKVQKYTDVTEALCIRCGTVPTYDDITWLNKAGDYGELDGYMAVGTDQYKLADGLYVKVADINITLIYIPSILGIIIF